MIFKTIVLAVLTAIFFIALECLGQVTRMARYMDAPTRSEPFGKTVEELTEQIKANIRDIESYRRAQRRR